MEYHKINGLYKRYNKLEHPTLPEGKRYNEFIIGDFAQPEFEYLFNNQWVWSEKLDGTNMRIYLEWDYEKNLSYKIRGKSEDANLPTKLHEWIVNWIESNKQNLNNTFITSNNVLLYGEGVGDKIQLGGNFGEQHFKLFDIYINGFYLEKPAITEIASLINLDTVNYWYGTIQEAIDKVKTKPLSAFGNFPIEGYVGQPAVRLFTAKGERICTKIKVKDFK